MGSKPNIIEPLAPLSTKQQIAAFLNVRRGRSIDFAATISAFHNQLAFRRHAALASTRTSQLGQQSQARRRRARVAAAPSTTTAPTTA
jgi:hypothetical protein